MAGFRLRARDHAGVSYSAQTFAVAQPHAAASMTPLPSSQQSFSCSSLSFPSRISEILTVHKLIYFSRKAEYDGEHLKSVSRVVMIIFVVGTGSSHYLSLQPPPPPLRCVHVTLKHLHREKFSRARVTEPDVLEATLTFTSALYLPDLL